ncbi:MAG: hypothetical protein CMM43_05615 [Rhodospirillaceae bacterium]|nr:hypothetical protein [Rhodospirillaceae bacterium]
MALRLSSPGISVREVDLTRGGVNASINVAAGIAGPFKKGPVNEVCRINNEKELIDKFGGPGVGLTDYHYETWYAASNFLSYGGQLDVVRAGGGNVAGSQMVNANAGVGIASTTTLVIDNYDDYNNNEINATNFYWAAKNPGSWGENLKVCVIDNAADQRITGVLTATVGTGTTLFTAKNIQVGYAVTQALSGVNIGIGTTGSPGNNDFLKGIVTGVGNSFIDVKVVSTVIAGVETATTYQQNSQIEFKTGSDGSHSTIGISSAALGDVGKLTGTPSLSDWYNQQNITTGRGDGGTDAITLKWRAVLPKPQTNSYVAERNGTNDAINIVVIDSDGTISGNTGTLLEKFGNLSKAQDADGSPNKDIYYKNVIADESEFIFAGLSPVNATDSFHNTQPLASGFSSGVTPITSAAGAWGQDGKDVKFNFIGNKSYTLKGGKDYGGQIGVFDADLGDTLTAYDKLADKVNSDIRFLLQGGASKSISEEQAKAQKLISICEVRKDCVAFISPNRDSVVNVTTASDQLANVQAFFAPLTSSSFAVFDSGYQYFYDRFNKKFNYMPLSSDIAGLCVRTDVDQFPWFSPAGTSRGSLAHAVKLAYNPGQEDRDQLYSNRINPVISLPGSGIVLFGDKTALSFSSAFDRINVRRLFITVEKAIEEAANAQLFELNDAGTRSNFVNIVEPFLRDVQAKRGVTDFLLVCDETNNTPDVIDRNEFVADIFLKPSRSINFIGLTFVATRTGVSFSEVVGTV